MILTALLASCRSVPKTELCLGTEQSDLACDNPNVDPSSYFRDLKKGDVCTNPAHYERLRSYFIDQEKQLNTCKANLAACQRGR